MQLNVSGKIEANDQLAFLRDKVPMTYIIEGEGALDN